MEEFYIGLKNDHLLLYQAPVNSVTVMERNVCCRPRFSLIPALFCFTRQVNLVDRLVNRVNLTRIALVLDHMDNSVLKKRNCSYIRSHRTL